jgi:hypothetical protein
MPEVFGGIPTIVSNYSCTLVSAIMDKRFLTSVVLNQLFENSQNIEQQLEGIGEL